MLLRFMAKPIKAAKALMTPEWRRYWYNRIIGQRHGKFFHFGDRNDKPMGYCEFCWKLKELMPFGPKEEWICFECGMKDEESERAMMVALKKIRTLRKLRGNKQGRPSHEKP